jgi:hypothetical protein
MYYNETDWDSVMDWSNDFTYFGGMDELSENEVAQIKLDNLRNKLYNEYIDLIIMRNENVKLSIRKTDKYLRLYEYFKGLSEDKINQWIKFPVDR